MSEKILSPDGKQEWNGTEWVPLSAKSTTPNAETIVNYANICLDALSRGDMRAAKEYYQKAKELDFKTAKRVFEIEYSADIGKGYADIMETYLVEIVRTEFSANMTHVGMGVVNWDIDGDFEMDHKLQNMNIAFDNAVAFFGNPNSMIGGGHLDIELGLRVDVSGLTSAEFYRDEDGDGLSDYVQNQDPSLPSQLKRRHEIRKATLTKKIVEGLTFTGVPDDEEVLKQQFRIGLILETASFLIMSRLEPVSNRIFKSPGTNAHFFESLLKKIGNADKACDKGRIYKLGATALALSADLPIDKWKKDDFGVVQEMLETTRESFRRAEIDYFQTLSPETTAVANTTTSPGSNCFIATAAFGTPYDSKIDVLRNWRDYSLKSSLMGRLFIRNYYFFSPPIASIVAKSSILRGIVRLILSPIIHLLKPKYSRPRNNRF